MKRRIGMVAVLAVFLTMLAGQAFAWGTKEIDNEKLAVAFAREVQRGAYKIVTTAELKAWIDQKKEMLLVDTNPADVYGKGHIPAAVHLEIQRPEITASDAKLNTALEKTLGADKNRVIVFYCGFTECTRSHNGAMWATRLGHKNVYRHPGGIKAWNDADYPVESSK